MVGAKGEARPVIFAPGEVKNLTPLVVPHGQICSSKLPSEAAVKGAEKKRDVKHLGFSMPWEVCLL